MSGPSFIATTCHEAENKKEPMLTDAERHKRFIAMA
jgi:hypothetical protein